MYTGWLKFGLYSAASATTNLSAVADAFKDAGMPLTFNGPDPSRDLPKQGGKPIPGLYIFVAPKLPLHFETFASDGDVTKSNSTVTKSSWTNTDAARESGI